MLFPEGSGKDQVWIAQGIEHDFAAQGKTLESAQKHFMKTIETHIAVCEKYGDNPFEGIPPAPSWFLREYELAQSETIQELPVKSAIKRRPMPMIFKHALV